MLAIQDAIVVATMSVAVVATSVAVGHQALTPVILLVGTPRITARPLVVVPHIVVAVHVVVAALAVEVPLVVAVVVSVEEAAMAEAVAAEAVLEEDNLGIDKLMS